MILSRTLFQKQVQIIQIRACLFGNKYSSAKEAEVTGKRVFEKTRHQDQHYASVNQGNLATPADKELEREAPEELSKKFQSDIEPLQPTADDNPMNQARTETISTNVKYQAEMMAQQKEKEYVQLKLQQREWDVAREGYRQEVKRVFGMSPEERVQKLAQELNEFEKSTYGGNQMNIYKQVGAKGTFGSTMAGWTYDKEKWEK
eukprot:403346068